MATKKKTASKPVKKAVAKKAPAKKATPVKKTVAKKAVAKKSEPAKKAAPAKKAIKKAVTKKPAPVKKAVAKKAAPAKKAIAKKAVPVKKPATAKKTVAKKPVAAKPATNTKTIAKKVVVTKKSSSDHKPKATAVKAAPLKKAAPAAKHNGPVKKPLITKKHTSDMAAPSARSEIRDAVIAKPRIKKSDTVIAHRILNKKANKQVSENLTMKEYNPPVRSLLDQPEQHVGPVYRYSDEELNEFRELILKRLESARENLNYYQALITRKDEAGTEDTDNRFNNLEDGSGAMEREQLSQLAARQIQFINHLEKALMRIENKTYGICRVTGKLIDKARLRAVPHATLSIEAKNMSR